jgi:hypothetical protein
MAETTSEGLASVMQLRQSIWKVEVTTLQFRKLVERLIQESDPEANFVLGDRSIYIQIQENTLSPDDLADTEELTEDCHSWAFSALVFEEPVG